MCVNINVCYARYNKVSLKYLHGGPICILYKKQTRSRQMTKNTLYKALGLNTSVERQVKLISGAMNTPYIICKANYADGVAKPRRIKKPVLFNPMFILRKVA